MLPTSIIIYTTEKKEDCNERRNSYSRLSDKINTLYYEVWLLNVFSKNERMVDKTGYKESQENLGSFTVTNNGQSIPEMEDMGIVQTAIIPIIHLDDFMKGLKPGLESILRLWG